MKMILPTLLLCISLSSHASVKVNDPPCPMFNVKGEQVGTKSTSVHKAMEKASVAGPGVYKLVCPDVTITVTKVVDDVAVLTWTAPTENTDDSSLIDLAGFRVYHGPNPDNLANRIDVVKSPLTIKNLSTGPHYFAVTAVNELGIESELSDIAIKEIK